MIEKDWSKGGEKEAEQVTKKKSFFIVTPI